MIRDEDVCAFALSRIFMYEPKLAKAVVETFGKATSIFGLNEEELVKALGPYSKYRSAILDTKLEQRRKELKTILDGGYGYLPYDDPCFPALLWDCVDSPVGFFVRASDDYQNIFTRENISVVGTRDASSYGKEWTERIVRSLGQSKVRPSIVSGLAFGIDIAAHRAAIEAGLPTIAVLGTGIGITYPRQHEVFAREIAAHPCSAVISEYPPDVDVLATNFLSRNRIIAGLSRSTVLVESRLKGGGMTTARIAASYDREVYAVPGRNDDIRSQGCNMLIYSHVAEPVISCEDFFKSLDYKVANHSIRDVAEECAKFYAGSMPPHKIKCVRCIIQLIRNQRDIDVSEIAGSLDMPYKDVIPLVQRMEADGFLTIDLLQRCSLKLSPL